MEISNKQIGDIFKVRIITYKWFRHYGGREVKTFSNEVNAILLGLQEGDQPYIVSIVNDVIDINGKLQYKAGTKLGISKKDFNF